MEKYFTPYEQALALKELGFDEECFMWWHHENNLTDDLIFLQYHTDADFCFAPTYSQAFKFFREKYGFKFYIYTCETGDELDYHPVIHLKGEREPLIDTLLDEWETYEEAELDCLITLIELVKK